MSTTDSPTPRSQGTPAPGNQGTPASGNQDRTGRPEAVSGVGRPQADTVLAVDNRKRVRLAERNRYLSSLPLHLVLTIVGLALALPFLWMVLTSLKPLEQVGLPSWIPEIQANADRGQFPPEAVQAIRDRLRNANNPAERFLAERIDLASPVLTPQQLADQINGVIQSGHPISADLFEDNAAMSASTRTFAQAYQTDRDTPIDANLAGRDLEQEESRRARNLAMYNAWALHDLLPGIVPAPKLLRTHNYLEVFRQIPFGRYYINSLFVASFVTFLQVLTSSLAAFSFSRLRWPGRDKVFLLYLSTMMLPGLVMMIPNYQIMITLGLVDTIAGLILPAAFTAFGTFLLRQFMLSIPPSLDEAAEIDGASKWRTYWDVILRCVLLNTYNGL